MSSESQHDMWKDFPAGLAGERLSFVPGTDRNTFDSLWREISAFDLDQVSRIMRADGVKASPTSLAKYANRTGWTGRVVLRNKMTCVAIYLAEHVRTGANLLQRDEYNDVKFFWVHPDHHDTKVPLHLSQLARLELPELPSRMSVNARAAKLIATLRDAGWTDLTDDDDRKDRGRAILYAPSVAGREYREALEASRAARPTPARGGRKRRGE